MFDNSGLFFLISSKKFQAKTKSILSLFLTCDLFLMGIFTPGINDLCLSLLSSTIKLISLESKSVSFAFLVAIPSWEF